MSVLSSEETPKVGDHCLRMLLREEVTTGQRFSFHPFRPRSPKLYGRPPRQRALLAPEDHYRHRRGLRLGVVLKLKRHILSEGTKPANVHEGDQERGMQPWHATKNSIRWKRRWILM